MGIILISHVWQLGSLSSGGNDGELLSRDGVLLCGKDFPLVV